MLRQITMIWCWPFRCKLRSLSPKRCEDCGVSRKIFSAVGSRPGLTQRCSAYSSSPLSRPAFPTRFFFFFYSFWMPVCLAGVVQNEANHWGKGAMKLLPAGPALHDRAPLSKQTVWSGPQARGNMEPVITSHAWLVHSPNSKLGQWLERVLHLTLANFSASVCQIDTFSVFFNYHHIKMCVLHFINADDFCCQHV